VSTRTDIAKRSRYECTSVIVKTPTKQPSLHYKILRMARTQKSKKMTDSPPDLWDDVDEETPPLTNTEGGSSGNTTATSKKRDSNLEKIAPLFFTNSRGDGDPFVTELKVKGIQTMAALFTVGSYNANSLYSAFGERELIPQLAMMQTLADYVKTNMPELVDTPSKCSKLTWDEIALNGFDKTLFKIHITAVYKGYV